MSKDSKYHQPYTTCDRTGRNLSYDDTVIEWTGLRVDKRVVDPRNPQDFVKIAKTRGLLPGQKYVTSTSQENNFNDWILDDLGNYIIDSQGNFLQSDLLVGE
jgi:hypothetical protein